MGGPRKSKRQFIDPEDDDMEPKKSRRTGEHDPTYYGDEMGEDLQEVEDEVRYGHERRRPRDPEKVGRSSYRQGVGRTAQPTGFGSSGIRHGPSEYLESSSRPSSQTGRPHVMTHQESFQAAWEQIQETKRKAQQAAEREEQWIEARKNPVVRKLLEEGRDDDVEALLDAAALLREMGRSTQ
jgi:hypothetical protein